MPTTTDALDALLAIRDGLYSARWNFPDALGTPLENPGGIGNPVELTYSFDMASDVEGFQPFGATQQQAVRDVLAHFAEIANLTFVETTGTGQLTFAGAVLDGAAGVGAYPNYSYAITPGGTVSNVVEQEGAGNIHIDHEERTYDELDPGQYGYKVLLHEVGHALGLRHPFASRSTDGYVLQADLDHRGHTVMSYTDAPGNLVMEVSKTASGWSSRGTYLSPSTLMGFDVEALQYLYGANTSTRAGNTVYRWDTNEELLETLWDGGGIDTIDASNQVFSNVIDLTPGSRSSIGWRQTDAELRQGFDIPAEYWGSLYPGVYDGANNLTIASGALIEHATGGRAADVLRGNDAANRLKGNAGNDTLLGGVGNDSLLGDAGSDSLSGGIGNDSYYVDVASDAIIEDAGAGTDFAFSSAAAYTLADNVENGRITHTGTAGLTGNALNNLLYAGSGANVLAGGAGVDTLSFLDATAGVTASLATGKATGGSGSDSFSGFERLAGSQHADKLTGDAAGNSLFGYAGNDVLDGGAGADAMTGGAGDDTYYVREQADGVIELAGQGSDQVYSYLTSYTLGADVERGRIVAGGAAALTGNALDNLLYAGTGDNVIDGGAGADRVSYYYTAGKTGVVANLSSGTVTGASGTDSLAGIEGLYGSQQADKLTGNTGANYLAGYAGNDVLHGGLGRDTMVGGDGNDIYYVSDATDLVSEAANGGRDAVLSYVVQHTLAANVEDGRIRYAGAGTSTLTGNGLDNLLYAGGGDNVLAGGAGVDTVSYADGTVGAAGVIASLATTAVQVTGGSGGDRLLEVENLAGSAGADRLTGNSGANTLDGGAGNDTLAGGAGRDVLVGGSGNDVFDFNVVADSHSTARDLIGDFVSGQDRIDLSGIDARVGTVANEAFRFIGSAAFSADASGQLRFAYDGASASVILYGSNDADAGAEFTLQLAGLTSVAAGDFLA